MRLALVSIVPVVLAPCLLTFVSTGAVAQQAPAGITAPAAPTVLSAPLPPKLTHAQKVFLSNAGSDSGLFPHPFSGDPDRGYNEFYADVQAMGRFTIVNDPAQADLVLELQLTAPAGPQSPNKQNGASDPLPMFRLVVYDASTHFVLWAVTESIGPANLQKTHDHNFDLALDNVTEVLKRVTTPPLGAGSE
jgi:hypothetical protein